MFDPPFEMRDQSESYRKVEVNPSSPMSLANYGKRTAARTVIPAGRKKDRNLQIITVEKRRIISERVLEVPARHPLPPTPFTLFAPTD
jgi:hypothetical protein